MDESDNQFPKDKKFIDLTGKPEHPDVKKAFEDARDKASPIAAIRVNLETVAEELKKLEGKVILPPAETRTDEYVDMTQGAETRTDDTSLNISSSITPKDR